LVYSSGNQDGGREASGLVKFRSPGDNAAPISVVRLLKPQTMLPLIPIRSLYPLALAEGEGVGSAYAYYAKRLVLARRLARLESPRRLLIAGLPQKFGSSLDSLLLAQDLAVAEVVVIDDRPSALEKCRRSLAAAQAIGELTEVRPHYVLVRELGSPEELTGKFDVCLGAEVLQRLDAPSRQRYVSCFRQMATLLALFVPNDENPSHRHRSGLAGLSLAELRALLAAAGVAAACGYVDMPPFPPGITRSAGQRERAKRGKIEGFAMGALGCYAHGERFFPTFWRRSHSHTVYAVAGP